MYRQVREFGFEGIEWSPRWFNYETLSDRQTCSLKNEVREHGLVICAINLNRFMLSRCAEAQRNHKRLLRSVDAAQELEAASVMISLSMPEPPSSRRALLIGQTIGAVEFRLTAAKLREAASSARSAGVNLVLELHDDGLLDTPELCLRMRDAIAEPNVLVNPDLGNLVRHPEGRGAWRAALQQLAPHAGYWHVKNYREGKPTPLWEGDVDYAEAMAVMQAHGYEGWVSIESDAGENVMELQRRSLQWLRQLDATTAA